MEPIEENEDYCVLAEYVPIEEVLKKAALAFNLPDTWTGGSGRGWSRYGTLQKCPQAFEYSYVKEGTSDGNPPAHFQIGSGLHFLLAVLYYPEIDGKAVVWQVKAFIESENVDPHVVKDVNRLFEAYFDNYRTDDYLIPLAVEVRAEDPETTDSCRFDLIARIDDPPPGQFPGVYNVEHKTAQRFDTNTLTSWDIDGEVLGQMAIYRAAGLDTRYGELQGTCVNIIGKQKEPQFERTFVGVVEKQINRHRKDLAVWREAEHRYMKDGYYPRATRNCVDRWGRCGYWDHCVMHG